MLRFDSIVFNKRKYNTIQCSLPDQCYLEPQLFTLNQFPSSQEPVLTNIYKI